MANTRFFLDKRKMSKGCQATLKLAIAQQSKTAYIPLGVKLSPEQWNDAASRIVKHPDMDRLNLYITDYRVTAERTILILKDQAKINSMDVFEVKSAIESRLFPDRVVKAETAKRKKNSFASRFIAFANSKKPSTKKIYMYTYSCMEHFEGKNLQRMKFEDVTKEWLTKFDVFLSETSPSKNARNIHLRNIRAVFNEAIDNEITTFYPFRRFKIRPVATPKRNLKVEDLRTLFNFPCEKHAVKYLDMFKLMFMLVGINVIDLAHLKELHDGRVEYYRAKTGRFYSIKVESEAMEIIERYRGKDWLVDILDKYKDYHDFTKRTNLALKLIGPVNRSGLGGKKKYKPLFPKISTYWARHTWATIAASLDIPKDTIAHALGHGGNTVTDIYIDFDQNKVDKANRLVLDWVLYGKK